MLFLQRFVLYKWVSYTLEGSHIFVEASTKSNHLSRSFFRPDRSPLDSILYKGLLNVVKNNEGKGACVSDWDRSYIVRVPSWWLFGKSLQKEVFFNRVSLVWTHNTLRVDE